MAITHQGYWDFHEGSSSIGLDTAGNGTVGNNATDGHPAPNYSSEEFTMTWANDGSAAGEFCFPLAAATLSGVWHTYACKFNWASFGTSGDTGRFFFPAPSSSAVGTALWSLWWDNDGDLWIEDANGTEITRDSTALSTDTEYYFVVKWLIGNSSTMKVWYWEYGGTRNTLIDSTTFDSDDGSTTSGAPAFVIGNGAIGKTYEGYAGTGFFRTDNGTNWDDNNTTNHGDTSDDQTIREWDGRKYLLDPASGPATSGTPDNGTALGAGQWDLAEDAPPGGSVISYSFTGVSTKEGYNDTSMDGPSGDAGITGDIVAAKWGWIFKSGGSSAKWPYFTGRYGHASNANYTAEQTRSSSYQYLWYITGDANADAGDVPTSSEKILIGFKAERKAGAPFSSSMTVQDMYATVLHIQPAPVTSALVDIIGGGLVPVPR